MLVSMVKVVRGFGLGYDEGCEIMVRDVRSLSVRELRRLVRELFRFYGRDRVFRDEFFDYFRCRGFGDDDIELLWYMVIGRSRLVRFGFYVDAADNEIPPRKFIKKAFIRLLK